MPLDEEKMGKNKLGMGFGSLDVHGCHSFFSTCNAKQTPRVANCSLSAVRPICLFDVPVIYSSVEVFWYGT